MLNKKIRKISTNNYIENLYKIIETINNFVIYIIVYMLN